MRLAFILIPAALLLVGCAGLSEFLAQPENQEAVKQGAETAGAAAVGFLGLPPVIGKAVGGVLANVLLSALGSREPKEQT